MDGCVALLVAYLVHGRYLRTGRLQDTLLAQGLLLLALAGLGLTLTLGVLPRLGPVEVWLALTLRVVGAALIAAAALAGRRQAQFGWARATPWVVPAVASSCCGSSATSCPRLSPRSRPRPPSDRSSPGTSCS